MRERTRGAPHHLLARTVGVGSHTVYVWPAAINWVDGALADAPDHQAVGFRVSGGDFLTAPAGELRRLLRVNGSASK